MYYKIYLVCLIVYVASENIIQFHFSATNDSGIYCIENGSNSNIYKTTVLEKEVLHIKVDQSSGKKKKELYKYINHINCSGGWNNTNTIIEADKVGTKAVLTAEKEMGGIWQCMILTNKNNNMIKPLQMYKEFYYTRADCRVQVHVRLSEPPQLILINRIELNTSRVLQESDQIDHIAVYNYSNNDEVDVFCVDVKKTCNMLEMSYDYASNLDDMFKRKLQSEFGVGFRTTLWAGHNNSSMICRCIGKNDQTIVKVIFRLRQDFEDIGIFQINNLPIRQTFSFNKNLNTKAISLNYRTLLDESVNIVCDSNSEAINIMEGGGTKCIKDSENSNNAMVNVTIRSDKNNCDLTCSLYETNVVEHFAVYLSILPPNFNDVTKLNIDFIKTSNNIIMEVYEYKREKWIYYGYEDGDNVTIACTKYIRQSGQFTYIDFNGTVIQNASGSTDIQLTSIHDNTTFKCVLKEYSISTKKEPHDKDNILRIINVWFHKRKAPVTEPIADEPEIDDIEMKQPIDDKTIKDSDESSGGLSHIIILVIVIIVVCIVLMCVSTLLCKMRNRKTPKNPSTPNYENLQRDDSFREPIPAYPPQWSHENPYQVPIDQRTANDNIIYSEPIREGNYATPIPKHLRPGKPKEPTYATLDLKPSDNSSNFNDSDRSQYAEIDLYSQVAKGVRNYDNVFTDSKYVNSKNTEYVEPTYCQAYFK